MKWLGQGLRAIVMTVLLLLCAALFYVLVIMGDTPGGDGAVARADGIGSAIVQAEKEEGFL